MPKVNLAEVFTSIQGESSFAGLSCFFVRLAGCNLRCSYCDTAYAYERGEDREVTDLVREWTASRAAMAEITGGEPLLQERFAELAAGLRDASARPVLAETNGSRDISIIPAGVIAVMDVKCPGSGENAAMDLGNLERLRPGDELKFVIADRADYLWARDFVGQHRLTAGGRIIHFSPAWGRLDPRTLAEWLVADGLPVRLQIPLHKVMGAK